MGCGPFNKISGSRRKFSGPIGVHLSSGESKSVKKEPLHPLDPDPFVFKILEQFWLDDYTVVKVNYPNCNQYEGNKILVFKGLTKLQLKQTKHLDPHFLEDSKLVARFVPTDSGWKNAMAYVRFLVNEGFYK